MRKAVKVVVSGRIENDNYTNKEGQMVYSVKVMIEEIEFAESKAAGGNQGNSGYSNMGPGDGFMNIPDGLDEELPFN